MQWSLCYIQGSFAYFTSQALAKQWGDDWNDAPYEHNAGTPYEWREGGKEPRYELRKVAFDGNFQTPCDGHCNSPFSVEMINRGDIAWLRGPVAPVPAGVSIERFTELVEMNGGVVFFQKDRK